LQNGQIYAQVIFGSTHHPPSSHSHSHPERNVVKVIWNT